jgi:DNA uptake protein ComE-like DNA-binding protein
MKGKWVYLVLSLVIAIPLAACSSTTPAVDNPAVSSAATAISSSVPPELTTSVVGTVTNTKVNINTADVEQFKAAIPGLGDRMVNEFEEYRPYLSIQQFRQEIGKYVEVSQVAEYEKYIYVPIRINDADAETLQQIPGVDASEAEAIIAGRPYAGVDDFMSRLSQYISAADLETARTYLDQQ